MKARRARDRRRTLYVSVAALIVVIAVIAGVTYTVLHTRDTNAPLSVENVGGKYNVTLGYYEGGYYEIAYTDETGYHSGHYFEPNMRKSLDWIRNNTVENVTFLCWWDYGHMLKGYAERNSIVRNPSHETMYMVTNKTTITEFDPNERITDVAKAFSTNSSTEMLQIMEKYNATYVLVYYHDLLKATWMYRAAGLNPTTFIVTPTSQNTTLAFTDAGKQTMIPRLLDNRDTGLTLAYYDSYVRIYKTANSP